MKSTYYGINHVGSNLLVTSSKTGRVIKVPVAYDENCNPVSSLPVGHPRKTDADTLVGALIYRIHDEYRTWALTNDEARLLLCLSV